MHIYVGVSMCHTGAARFPGALHRHVSPLPDHGPVTKVYKLSAWFINFGLGV